MARPSLALLTLSLGCPRGPADSALDTADTAPVVAQCPVDVPLEGDFAVVPDGLLTQIHPSAAWDGEGVWVAFTQLEPTGSNFDIFATRVSPLGEVWVPPFQVDGGEGYSETYPRVAVGRDRVLVAWQADNGTGVDNLDLTLRGFTSDGAAIDPQPSVVEPEVGGDPQEGNGWMPALAADPSGGFALAGAFALDSVDTFQTTMVELDGAGAVSGAGVVPEPNGQQSHYYPSVATGPGGQRALAWESWTASGATAIHAAVVGSDGTAALASFTDHDDAGLPFVSWERGSAGQPYLAWYAVNGSEYDLVLAGGDMADAPVLTTLGVGGRIDHTPIVAAGERGAVVAWLRMISGLRNELVLRPVLLDGGTWILGDELTLETTTDVAPYLPGLSWICEDLWFVTWVEGDNPDYRVRGRFLRFEGFGV